jgi:hypothetical protein
MTARLEQASKWNPLIATSTEVEAGDQSLRRRIRPCAASSTKPASTVKTAAAKSPAVKTATADPAPAETAGVKTAAAKPAAEPAAAKSSPADPPAVKAAGQTGEAAV